MPQEGKLVGGQRSPSRSVTQYYVLDQEYYSGLLRRRSYFYLPIIFPCININTQTTEYTIFLSIS
jgi:hypothetical protein